MVGETMTKTTFLFDLDGTLLPMDFDHFMKLYFHNMGVHFGSFTDPNNLMKNVLLSTEQMIMVNDGRTNEEIFMEHFKTLIAEDIDEYIERFHKYYDTLFANVQPSTYQSQEMIDSVQTLIDKGYEVVIATNPLFPYKANLHRIRWAGLDPNQFSYISSYEENKHCKPHVAFYQEVLDNINKQPEECIMVGNDVFDDLPAKKLGIDTYLVTDCLLNRHNQPINSDYQGTYQDFYSFVKALEPIK